MPYTDFPTGTKNSNSSPSSSSSQQYGFVCMSTVDDLSYTPSEQEKFRDEAQMAATGRRSWKTLKGKGEAVWPPVLEAALIEALEKYHPDSTRANKILGRFPMRNRFVSDYIFETTGKRRTPKQVGSRLQQLRDTCKDPRILQLISRRASDLDSLGTPSPPPGNGGRLVMYTDIMIDASYSPSLGPTIEFKPNDITSPLPVHLSPVPASLNRPVGSPNVLRQLNRSVQLSFPFQLVLQSTFVVYKTDEPVHQEIVPLRCTHSPQSGSSAGQWCYTTELSPNFWENLCNSRDPTKYVILQNMTLTPPASEERHQISIVYYFSYPEEPSDSQYPESTYTNSPQFSQHSASSQDSAYHNANYMTDAGQYYYRQDSPNWEGYPAAPQAPTPYSRPEPPIPRASATEHIGYPSSGATYSSQITSSWVNNQHPVANYGNGYYS